MKAHGVLVPIDALRDGAVVQLDPAEQHHLRVRRIPAGAPVRCYDGAGGMATGTLISSGAVEVDRVARVPPPPPLVLAVGAGDKDRFAALAERCTELGVTRLIPLMTERAHAVNSRTHQAAAVRAGVRAREACKQCGNPWATVVDRVHEIRDIAAYGDVRWHLADGAGASCPGFDATSAVGWIIGPEGGLTDEERELCTGRLGARRVTLAAAVLRFDTAAIAAAAITWDRRYARSRDD